MLRRFAPVATTCEGCRVPFMTRWPQQRFCSRSCAAKQPRPNRSRAAVLPKTCVCGRVFVPLQPRVRFCSRECVRRHGGIPRIKTCPQCMQTFETKSAIQVYCNRRCQREARLARTVRICEECGGTYHALDARRRYCSRGCATHRGEKYRGPNSPLWKGGRTFGRDGYVRVRAPEHHRATPRSPYVLEHILVMEQILGRPLERHERVHHRNGMRRDNRPENLELWKVKDPPGVRAADYHCAGCTCIREGA